MPLIVSKKELPDLQSNIRFTNDERNMMIVYCNCLPLVGYFPQRLPWRPSPKAVAPRSPTKITKKIFILHWEADQTPGHHYPCAVPSQVGRGAASSPPDSVLFRFNSYLKNLISFTGCTVDITHSRALLTTCKSQRLQQSSTMQLMSGSSVCHQKRTKGIEAKESKIICTSSPMLHEGKHESEFAAVCKYFQNIQKGNLPLQSWSTAEKALSAT